MRRGPSGVQVRRCQQKRHRRPPRLPADQCFRPSRL